MSQHFTHFTMISGEKKLSVCYYTPTKSFIFTHVHSKGFILSHEPLLESIREESLME